MSLTHRCPECGASFLGPAECRPCPANNFAHPESVQTLPIIGCEEPPTASYTIILRGVGVGANTHHRARELALHTVQDLFGGDTKRAEWAMSRVGYQIEVVPNCLTAENVPHDPTVVVWEPRA